MSASVAPPALPRLAALDGVRVVGASAVVLQHVGYMTGVTTRESWGGWIAIMDFAVALFFVLSGFLLFRPWAKAAATGERRPSGRRFFGKRAARILPAYVVVVAVCLTVLRDDGPAPVADWVRHLTFTQIYEPGAIRRGLGQTWTLATEVVFYLVLPLVAAALTRKAWRPRRTVYAAAAGGLLLTVGWVAALAAGLLDPGLHIMWFPAYAAWFAAGIAMAAAYVAVRTGTAPRSWRVLDGLGSAPFACWAVAVALLAIATTPVTGPRGLEAPHPAEFATQLTLYLAVAVLVMLPLVFGPAEGGPQSLLAARPVRWLGTMSYGMFLWHPLVLDLIYRIGGRAYFTGDLAEIYAMTWCGGVLVAALSYYALERPILRWANRPRRRRVRPSAAATATDRAESVESQRPVAATNARS